MVAMVNCMIEYIEYVRTVDGDTDVGSPSRVRCFPVSYRPSSSGVYVVVETETTTSLLRDSEGRGMTPGSLG